MAAAPQVFQVENRGQATADGCQPDLVGIRSILVVGLGNPILGDDGVGWSVATHVRQLLGNPHQLNVTVECLSLGGLSLMEQIVGYDYVLLIDAISSEKDPPGMLTCSSLDAIEDPSSGHTASTHDTTLQNAIRIGRSLGAHLPAEILVVGVATNRSYDFSEELTPAVAAAVPRAARLVIDLITRSGSSVQKERLEP